jgi:SAM-dependent methyltransferase
MNMTERGPALLSMVASYYGDKLARYGPTPAGVDWNGQSGQLLRFEQLTKILPPAPATVSVNDIGCGYGALLEFLAPAYHSLEYEGIDIAAPMIEAAQTRHNHHPEARFLVRSAPTSAKDFCIASGIFSVRLSSHDHEWLNHVNSTLDMLDSYSKKGFSFNCLTKYSDAEKMRCDLYYADPLSLFDFCKKRFSQNVALLHDYGLYEFTILVRK